MPLAKAEIFSTSSTKCWKGQAIFSMLQAYLGKKPTNSEMKILHHSAPHLDENYCNYKMQAPGLRIGSEKKNYWAQLESF